MYNILWAGTLIIVAAVMVGWAAETAQLYIGQGLALAILAWLQTSPEFAVEAVIAWDQNQRLMIANLTGSLRLLVGFGWPLIYFTHAFFKRKFSPLKLSWFNGLEVLALLLGTMYFGFVWRKGSLTVGDSFFLLGIYLIYLFELTRIAKYNRLTEEENDLPFVGKKIQKLKRPTSRFIAIALLFCIGAVILRFSVEPFLRSLQALALSLGISSFYFVQWCAPFVSEFPEKVTAFKWAASKKAPMAIVNMISSNIVQWTIMAGLIPVIYSISRGELSPILFDSLQLQEIQLTVLQSFLSILFLMDLEVSAIDAFGLFILWAFQFFYPQGRALASYFYEAWILIEAISLLRKRKFLYALTEYRRQKNNAKS